MSDTSSPDPVRCTVEDGVAVVRLDDGKVNVVSHRVIELVHAALDEAIDAASSVAIIGREGKLSAGFDLAEMTAGIERTQALVGAGGRMLMRIYGHPQPVVLGVTGHALAAGALLTLACDTRIGGDGPAKIGLNETAIGMGLPHYAVELAQARITPAHLLRAAVQAEIYDAAGAVEAGYLDRVVPAAEVEAATIAEARRLGALPGGAYRHTKLALHQALIDRVLPNIDADMQQITAPAS
jgi:enoyl-CoA hydratase